MIFFVYLYQRWIYLVDDKRINEYSQVGGDGSQTIQDNKAVEDTEKEVLEKETKKVNRNSISSNINSLSSTINDCNPFERTSCESRIICIFT